MAIYHFSGSVISRTQGRSAIACSAYRSGQKLYDNRLSKGFDYSKKQDVVYSEILLPESAPAWMSEREALWNAVEENEKRKDAQLAREFNFSLPQELSLEQNIELAREFVQKEFVDLGMVADLCVHNDKTPEGELQPHAHVMLTMREVTAEGFGQKVREWNDKSLLMHWREAWAEYANKALALNGHDMQIDHRSYEDQGIDLEPQYKIGSAVARERMSRLEDHQRIARENGERIAQDPSMALDAITRQQSTFTRNDIAKFVHRHSDSAEQFQAVLAKVMSLDELVLLGQDARGVARYTTQEMLDIESGMMAKIVGMDVEGHAVEVSSIKQALENRRLTVEQEGGFRHLTNAGDIKCVIGYAGTGKSYLLGAAREAWEQSGYRVLGSTLSGIAAESLEGSSGVESRTIASRQWYWDRGREKLGSRDILVIDEAGMIGSRQMARIVSEVHEAGAKLVLIGDPEQLQAIEAGAAFRAITERAGHVEELTEIRRQVASWQKEATKDFALGETESAMKAYDDYDHLHEVHTDLDAKKQIIQMWNDVRISDPAKSQIILASTRAEVQSFNGLARAIKQKHNELGEDHRIETFRGERQLAEGDRIYFMRNEKSLGVKNGTLGNIERIENKMLHVVLDSGKKVEVNTDFYNHIEYGYAATVHKAQAITVDRTYVLGSGMMDRHAAYVAMSRHRESADFFYSLEQFRDKGSLLRSIQRERKKDMALDYKDIYAARRGMGEDRVISLLEYEGARALLEGKKEGLSIAEKAAHLANELDEAITTYKKEVSQQWKLEQGRVVYGILRKALNDQEVNAYMAEHMPKEYERFQGNLTKMLDLGFDRLVQKETARLSKNYAKAVDQAFEVFHGLSGEQKLDQGYKIYGLMKEAFADDLTREYMEEHMPKTHKNFNKNIEKITSTSLGKRYEQKAVALAQESALKVAKMIENQSLVEGKKEGLSIAEQAAHLAKCLDEAVSGYKETEGRQAKFEQGRVVYGILRKALNDKEVSAHMAEHMPKEYERFKGNLTKMLDLGFDRLVQKDRNRELYLLMRKAFTDPLVKQHMKKNMPKEYRLFDRTLTNPDNQKIFQRINREIERAKAPKIDKSLEKSRDFEMSL